MEQYLTVCQNNPLFAGVEPENLVALLGCLAAKKERYAKGSVIFQAGETINRLGILLTGRVNTVYEDLLGGRSIIDTIEPGQLFGDAFSCAQEQRLPVHMVAQTECEVLFIGVESILHTCASACAQHRRLIENMVHILAEKYVQLNRKMVHLSGRTTRRKLLSYFFEQAKNAEGKAFFIPFTQQELADYLFIDRSGLSTELNRLKKEGLIEQQGGKYRIYTEPCAGNDCDR